MKFGRKMNIAQYHKQALVHAGFQDVVNKVRKVSLAVLCMILQGPAEVDDFLKR